MRFSFVVLGFAALMLSGCFPGSNPIIAESSVQNTQGGNVFATRRADGTVTGSADPNWSDSALRANEIRAVCSEGAVQTLDIKRDETGAATFKGKCK